MPGVAARRASPQMLSHGSPSGGFAGRRPARPQAPLACSQIGNLLTACSLAFWLTSLRGNALRRAYSAEDASPPAADDPFSSTVRPILAARCFGCHAGKTPESGLDLTRFKTRDEVLGAFRLWEKVNEKVDTRAMPPEDAKPLSDLQRRTFCDWHQRTFVALEPRPGRGRARRLTRTEYRNTLADLLDIPLRKNPLESFYNVEAGSIVEKLLPVDPPGPSGFDNDASVLAFGSAELARSLQVADYLVDQLDSLPEASPALFAAGSSEPVATPHERATVILGGGLPPRAFRRPVVEAGSLLPFLAVFEAALPRRDQARPPRSRIHASPRPSRSHSRPSSSRRSSSSGSSRPAPAVRTSPTGSAITSWRPGSPTSSGRRCPTMRSGRWPAEGRLHERDVLERQVERMLADPRSIALAENFGGQWLGYAELDSPDRFQVSRSRGRRPS